MRNRRAELKDAADLWGKDAIETEAVLIERHSRRRQAKVAGIGPAGEKLSLISGVSNDRGRMAARSGIGAMMGSKRLKAVVCGGTLRIGAFDREEIRRLSKKCTKFVLAPVPFVSGKGAALRGDSPLGNWKGSSKDWTSERSASVNPDLIVSREKVKYHCYSCPLGCGGICTRTGKFSETHKPEYETTLALGGLCLNDDPESIFYLNEILNRAGMDAISAGGTVAFASECYERGVITKEDTGGLELTWGNSKAIVELIEKMIAREGIGRPALTEGPNHGRTYDLETMMSKYWERFGWDPQTGKPTDQTMEKLGSGR